MRGYFVAKAGAVGVDVLVVVEPLPHILVEFAVDEYFFVGELAERSLTVVVVAGNVGIDYSRYGIAVAVVIAAVTCARGEYEGAKRENERCEYAEFKLLFHTYASLPVT